MKKIFAILCLTGLLCGCGNVSSYEGSLTEKSTAANEAATSETTAAIVSAITETDSATVSATTAAFTGQISEDPANPSAEASAMPSTEPATVKAEETHQSPAQAYRSALQAKIDYVHWYSPRALSITYTLYDMDKDGTPELLIQYGTAEDDFLIAVYTYRNGELKELADKLPGGHTSFAYDYAADQFVLAHGHMGHGLMTWYDLDENGEFRSLISTDSFYYGSEDSPTYDDYMAQYNVAWLDRSIFFQFDGEEKTWLTSYCADEPQLEEYKGFDYRFLENYAY